MIARLKVDSSEYDSKIKRAAQGIQHMADACHRAGGMLNVLEDENREFIKGLGNMETVSKSARGKIAELTTAFTDLKSVYNSMSAAEKSGEVGRELNKQLEIMKGRILDGKRELRDIGKELEGSNSRFGKFGSLVDGLGQKMGLNVNLTEMLTSKASLMAAGIGAATTAVVAATKAWAEYNSELAKQQQITTVTTGLNGGDADQMTAAARAISKVYGADFREVINAANTLMTQFGKTGDESIQLIRDGMQGMIMGDGGKLLSMIQQYAPAFRDAGIEASQLIAIIQNSEGGIFSAENMNAIVMGIKNIRLMTNATSDALTKIGIDGQKMSEQLRNGTLTIFDALGKVAKAIENTNSSSQEAGQVMQQVFGRQGAMAGTKLGEAIATLNTNLDETKRQTGEVGEGYDELTGAVYRFETALQKTFGFKGWEEMESFIKTDFYNTLSDVIEVAGRLYQTFWSTNDILDEIGKNTAFENMLAGIIAITQPLVTVALLIKQIRDGYNQAHAPNDWMGGAQTGGISVKPEGTYTETRVGGVLTQATRNGKDVTSEILEYYNNLHKPKKTPKGAGRGGGSQELDVMAANSKMITELSKQAITATDEERVAIREKIKALQDQNKEYQYYIDLVTGKIKQQEPIESGQGIGLGTVDDISKELSKPLDVSAIKTPLQSLEEELKNLIELQKLAWSPEQFQAYQAMIEKVQGEIGDFKGIGKEGKETEKSWGNAASAIQSVGSAMSQIEDPAAKVMGTIAQAIATIALTYAKSLEGTFTPWDWIAGAAAGLAQMTAVISAIHSTTGYAQGGMIKGNSYSGDNIGGLVDGSQFVGLNAGEVVLNASQQSMLAQNLQGNGGGMHVVGEIQGEKIVLVANRFLRRSGQGELVTWK